MTQTKLIVFDMDGVLIDVSGSYREAVRRTAALFFQGAAGDAQLPDPLFPLEDLGSLKQTGGLNNDWDLTAAALHLLFSKVIPIADPLSPDPADWGDRALASWDVTGLARFLRSTPSPLMDLFALHGRAESPFVAGCYRGDVGSGNRIKRIFQEIYLGGELFATLHGEPPRFHTGLGLIHDERPFVDRALLAALARDHLLAIATGRPRAEADYPLDRFALRPFFRAVVTHDDGTLEEQRRLREEGLHVSLQKPDPYLLDLAAARVGGGFGECLYVGDMPDDMLAARSSRSGYRGVGVLYSTAAPERRRDLLQRAGAWRIIAEPEALATLALSGGIPAGIPRA